MPEIRPDLSDESRCIFVHWNLPVQCVLPSSHRENWHEAWHPQTGNRIRYRRSYGNFVTEDLHHDEWHDLEIPPPGGFCNDQFISTFGDSPNVRCTGQYGHGWNHRAVVDGCTYSWNTPIPKDLTVDQLTRDVTRLRGMLVAAHSRIAELEAQPNLDDVIAWLGKKAREYQADRSNRDSAADAIARMADKISRGAIRPTREEAA